MRHSVLSRRIILALSLISTPLKAQIDLPALLSEDYFDLEQYDAEELADLLAAYQAQPLLWDEISGTELESLPLAEELRARLTALKSAGLTFTDQADFRQRSGMTDEECQIVTSFIRFQADVPNKIQVVQVVSLRNRDGTTDFSKNLLRTRIETPDETVVGLVIENDGGESQVADYWNVTMSRRLGKPGTIFAGAYRLRWGGGLLFNSTYINRSGGAVFNALGSGHSGIRNYVGADENRFLSGVAINLHTGRWQFCPFFSQHHWDATLYENTITALRTDGLHITSAQIQAKDQLREKLWGGGVVYNSGKNQFGVLVARAWYSYPLSLLNNQSAHTVASIFCRFGWQATEFQGELVQQSTSNLSVFSSIRTTFEKIKIGLGGCYIAPEYFAPYANPLKHYSGMPANEWSIFSGVQIAGTCGQWFHKLEYYRRIKTEKEGEEPPGGLDYSTGWLWRDKHGGRLELWLRRSHPTAVEPDDIGWQAKLALEKRLTNECWLTFRVAWRVATESMPSRRSIGYSLYLHQNLPADWELLTGTTQFFIPSSALRIGLYEPGVPLQFNLVTLSDTGWRWFAVVEKRFSNGLKLIFCGKLHQTYSVANGTRKLTAAFDLQLQVDI